MRGEDAASICPTSFATGSPPHARGRQERRCASWQGAGITPACAGKTWIPLHADYFIRDHPRMRGEDGKKDGRVYVADGSPPHARGRPAELGYVLLGAGITPACAGKTPLPRNRCQPRKDHPRMRGEDAKMLAPSVNGQGSPPHARGRLSG